jgi:transcriptional regulator with XRE-family HTH domain
MLNKAYIDMVDHPDVTSAAVDIGELAALLRSRRAKDGLSLRQVSAETGVPFSTLSRVESGKVPDLATFRNIVSWLGISPERFFPTSKVRAETTPDAIAKVLRNDPALDEKARDELTSLVSRMYANLAMKDDKIQMHLRSKKSFTPEAGGLLADLLREMQEKLSGEGELK